MVAGGQGSRPVWPVIAIGTIVVLALTATAVGILLADGSARPPVAAASPASAAPVPSPAAPVPSPAAPVPSPAAPVPSPAAPTSSPEPTPPTPTAEVSVAPEAPTVVLTPINTPVDDYTEPFGQDRAIPAAQVEVAGEVSGDAVGTFAGTKGQKELTCDRSRLADILEAAPDLAKVWAGAAGVRVRDLRDFLMRLTPVVLRTDTIVTLHGAADGRPTSTPAVIQAGTAVLVSDRGEPLVRCFGSNPLSPASALTPQTPFGGFEWETWDADQVVRIAAASEPLEVFGLVDIRTARPFDRPVGIHGTQDTWAR